MSDVPALLKMYVEEGRMNKSPDFSIDDKVLSASKQYA